MLQFIAQHDVLIATAIFWVLYAPEVGDTCRKNGLLVSVEGDVLMFFPALTITRQTAERGLDIFERALKPR